MSSSFAQWFDDVEKRQQQTQQKPRDALEVAAAAAAAGQSTAAGATSGQGAVENAARSVVSWLGENPSTRSLGTWVSQVTGVGPLDQHESDVEQGERDPLKASSSSSSGTTAGTTAGDSLADQFTISRTERFKYFVALLVLSIVFFLSSLFFLPMVVLLPGKFAFAFTCGSVSDPRETSLS